MVKKSKISVCKNCGNPLPEKATVCPSCGAKNKKPIYKKWWFWLIVVLIAAGAVAGGSNNSAPSDDLSSSLVASGEKNDVTSGNAPPADESNEPDVSATPEDEDDQSSSEPAPSAPELIDGMHPEFKEAMDTYEAFFDEYIAFMKKYAESDGTDLTLLSDYADYMSKYAETMEAFEEWENKELNTAETAYYIEVQTRISQKLLQVAQQVPQ